MKIRVKLLSILLLLSAGPILIANLIIYKISSDKIENLIEQQSRAAVDKLTFEVDKFIDGAAHKIELISSEKQVLKLTSYPTRTNRAKVQNLLEGYLSVGIYFKGFIITDTQGNELIKVYKDKTIPARFMNIKNQDFFKIPFQDKKTFLSDLIKLNDFQNKVFIYSTPILNPNGKTIGILVGIVETDFFIDLTTKFNITRHSYPFIITKKGIAIAHPDRSKILKANIFKETKMKKEIKDSLRLASNGYITYLYKNTKKYMYFSRDATGNFIIANTIPADDYFSMIHQLRWTTIIVIIIFSIVSIIISLIISNQITTPIKKILAAIDRIKKGDLSFSVKYHSKDEINLVIKTFNEMIQSLKERNLIKQAFGKYVSTQIADKILKEEINLKGEEQELTILFSDIRDFTAMSEKMSPKEVVSFLNNYFSHMVQIIFKHEGMLDKFIGDGLMALFGAPLPHKDDPLRAIKCAIEMQATLSEINTKRRLYGKKPIKIGIGIHTGKCVVGNIGSDMKLEYTAIGDNVNIASHVEGLNKTFNTSILITESTYEKIKQKIEVERIGAVNLKTRTQQIIVYKVVKLLEKIEKS